MKQRVDVVRTPVHATLQVTRYPDCKAFDDERCSDSGIEGKAGGYASPTGAKPHLFGTPALHELIDVMRVTLAGNGVGLAAPQSAVPLRLFVVEDTQDRMSHLSPEQQKGRNRYPFPFEAVINPIWYATSREMVIETEGCLSIPVLRRMFAATRRSRSKDFSRKASGKPGPSKDGRHASFNMKSITLTDGCLPIACFKERSHRPSRMVQVLRPIYSNASPFRSNRPRKSEEVTRGDPNMRSGLCVNRCDPHLPRDAGSRAIILRSGPRHFSPGADLDIFDKRAEQAASIQAGKTGA